MLREQPELELRTMSKTLNTIKNHPQEYRLFTQRLILAALIIGLIMGLLVLRLAYLQILAHKLYTTLSEQNQLTIKPLEPKRGLIYDRHGILLAENIPVYSLEITPEYVTNLTDTLARLQKLLKLSNDDIESFYDLQDETPRYHSIPLKVHLSEADLATFMSMQYQFPGVFVRARLWRHYPMAEIFAHVLGYVGHINPKEWAKLNSSNYSDTDYIGKIGIERSYENILHGTTGYAEVETDASGRVLNRMSRVAPVSGANLYLTIDSELQKAAMHALENRVGAIAAIDPRNGEILALVSNPSFDPNLLIDKISPAVFKALQTSPDHPLYNRSIRGIYPIASTIKPFYALLGLASNFIDENYAMVDKGHFELPHSTHHYRDSLPYGHGVVNVAKAITYSCDVFFFTLATKMGIDRMDNWLAQFGFGALTGVDLHEETSGVLASPSWKLQHKHTPWNPGDTVNSAIGQGFMSTTPLQLATAAATLATGNHYLPHLVLRHEDAYQQKFTHNPVLLNTVMIDPAYRQIVVNAMRKVISEGTARTRFGEHVLYDVAGKTGTAQVFSLKQSQKNIHLGKSVVYALRNHSLFIAFAPADNPIIAIAVVVEHDTGAPTVARQVLDAYLVKPKIPGKSS